MREGAGEMIEMHNIYPWNTYIRVAPDTELAGYPANLFCRISGIRPDIRSGRISGLAGYPAE